MGLGDKLLAAGQAKLIHKETGEKISIGDGQRVEWFSLYKHIPYLSYSPARWLIDYPGVRGYYHSMKPKAVWNWKYKAEPAELADDTQRENFVLIEPNIKKKAPRAKLWPFERWQELVNRMDARFVQPNYGGAALSGVKQVKTDIPGALHLMRRCLCFVGSEGFLHHLAAATNTPAVVLFGSWSPPEIVGYDFHENIAHGPPEGIRADVPSARRGILATSVDEVKERLERLL